MQVRFSPGFDKQFIQRLTHSQQIQVLDTIEQFQDEPYHKDLRNHSLGGKWFGHRSISIGGDLRLHFRMLDNNTAYFVATGNHDQLYG
ncbi:MAG TPA: type II toxin-antitoxin system mRNA interferase toxin, RelE/StbE family [Candidatus Saccharimonadales bacterium]|jgi:addiction module RelE/StbE family toxin|nr:type II toxin-antitoxin system mRNA interferase toxin, RelE/StbE family [Candidatus Saccharimonadales bacterium]